MKDAYKANIIKQHIEATKNDEYYFAQVTGSAGKPINLDESALTLLKNYYEGHEAFQMRSAEDVIASRDENNYAEDKRKTMERINEFNAFSSRDIVDTLCALACGHTDYPGEALDGERLEGAMILASNLVGISDDELCTEIERYRNENN